MKPLKFLELRGTPILEQLQLEEALLRASEENVCLVNTGAPPAIVLGISGKVDQWVHLPSPLPLIRRFSGGGTVVVDEETLFVTLIANVKDVPIDPFPKQVLGFKGSLYSPFFPQGFAVRENDYVIEAKKVGGNAQYFTKERWLHHTTFLWNFDPHKMALLKHPPKEPKYRQGRPHSDFLATLSPHFLSQAEMIEGLKVSLRNHFALVETSIEECRKALSRPHRRSTQILFGP
jgi:lipoate-protein ligase A